MFNKRVHAISDYTTGKARLYKKIPCFLDMIGVFDTFMRLKILHLFAKLRNFSMSYSYLRQYKNS